MHYWYFSYCRMVFFCILGECLSLHQISSAISAEVRALQINMPAQNILWKEFSTLETTPLVVDQILFIFFFISEAPCKSDQFIWTISKEMRYTVPCFLFEKLYFSQAAQKFTNAQETFLKYFSKSTHIEGQRGSSYFSLTSDRICGMNHHCYIAMFCLLKINWRLCVIGMHLSESDCCFLVPRTADL